MERGRDGKGREWNGERGYGGERIGSERREKEEEGEMTKPPDFKTWSKSI